MSKRPRIGSQLHIKRKPVDQFRYVIRKVLLLAMILIVAFPLLYMASSSLFSADDFNNIRLLPKTPVWSNYARVFGKKYFPTYLFNSVGTSMLASMVRTVVVTLAAFALTHLRFRGRKLILSALVLTLFVPQEAILYQNYRTVAGLGLLDTWAGIISTGLFSASQMLLLMGSFLAQGRDGYDAARMDGARDLRYIASVLVPLSGPAVLTVALQSAITTFNGYLWPLLVTNRPQTRTIQIGITMLGFAESNQIGAQMASIVLVTVPFLVLLAFAMRRIQSALISNQ